MTDPIIKCPKCAHEIKLTESLAAPMLEDARKAFAKQLDEARASVVTGLDHIVLVAEALRFALIEGAMARKSQEGRHTKTEMLLECTETFKALPAALYKRLKGWT